MTKWISEQQGRLPRLENAGMDGWLVRLFSHIEPQNLDVITAFVSRCQHVFGEYLVDIVPSYTTVLVQFDAMELDHGVARALLERLITNEVAQHSVGSHKALAPTLDSSEVIELPIWYHPSVGPELLRLSQHTGLDTQALIQRHSQTVYRVFALGFAPGFSFMGSLPSELELPRLSQPRAKVPAGSLAIANLQTAIYPQVSPGGWNIIGRCPTPLFDLDSATLSLLKVGDSVRFIPISQAQFEHLGGDSTPLAAEHYE